MDETPTTPSASDADQQHAGQATRPPSHEPSYEELARITTRFQLAEHAANAFIFEWDLRTGEVYRSAGAERLLGYRSHEIPPTWEGWAQLTDPRDFPIRTEAEARLPADRDQRHTGE